MVNLLFCLDRGECKVKFLVIGDVVGRSGLNVIKNNIDQIIKNESIDYIIINGENSASGRGIKEKEMKEIFSFGANVITMGNHLYYRKEAKALYQNVDKLLIPANVTNLVGHGVNVQEKNDKKIAVINLLGKVGMGELNQENISDPFAKAREIVNDLKKQNVDYIFVDFHAEATAEKIAMSYFLENDVTCVFGTHTHVQTSDEAVYDSGLAYITDVGMCGPRHSVLGLKKEIAVARFVTGEKIKYECSDNPGIFRSIIVETDDNTNRAISIKRYNIG